MKLDVLNSQNKVTAQTHIPDIKDIRYDLIMDVVLWQRSKRRSAIANTKSVSEISGSTRKIYRQKGTGSARHGSIKRNIFRGGAPSFGPSSAINYTYSINKRVRLLALQNVVSLRIKNNDLLIYEQLVSDTIRTADFINLYSFVKCSTVLFVSANFTRNFILSSRNLSKVSTLHLSGLNVYDILSSDKVCFSCSAFIEMKKKFLW